MFDVHFLLKPSYETSQDKVYFSIKLAVFQASGGASINLKKPTPAVSNGSVRKTIQVCGKFMRNATINGCI
jgi:hypothetical protein